MDAALITVMQIHLSEPEGGWVGGGQGSSHHTWGCGKLYGVPTHTHTAQEWPAPPIAQHMSFEPVHACIHPPRRLKDSRVKKKGCREVFVVQEIVVQAIWGITLLNPAPPPPPPLCRRHPKP